MRAQRSNPESLRGRTLDCFAALAMTEDLAPSRLLWHRPATRVGRSLCSHHIFRRRLSCAVRSSSLHSPLPASSPPS
ncbi:hypothetical protein EOW77_0021955 [Bradyrhizobium yuanmingense]|nr:hypothetical protein EOW77_0021955 [Bradyrhizobium yuanmingense]